VVDATTAITMTSRNLQTTMAQHVVPGTVARFLKVTLTCYCLFRRGQSTNKISIVVKPNSISIILIVFGCFLLLYGELHGCSVIETMQILM
jgi:hypothetical protein